MAGRHVERQETGDAFSQSLAVVPRRNEDSAVSARIIHEQMAGRTSPETYGFGSAKKAAEVANALVRIRPGEQFTQYITSVTKAGGLRVLNAGAVANQASGRLESEGAATVNPGNRHEAGGIANRLNAMGYVAEVTKEGFVRAVNPDKMAKLAATGMGSQESKAVEVGSGAQAAKVAESVNRAFAGRLHATVRGGDIEITNIGTKASAIVRSVQEQREIKVTTSSASESESLAKAINSRFRNFHAYVTDDGALGVERIGERMSLPPLQGAELHERKGPSI